MLLISNSSNSGPLIIISTKFFSLFIFADIVLYSILWPSIFFTTGSSFIPTLVFSSLSSIISSIIFCNEFSKSFGFAIKSTIFHSSALSALIPSEVVQKMSA